MLMTLETMETGEQCGWQFLFDIYLVAAPALERGVVTQREEYIQGDPSPHGPGLG